MAMISKHILLSSIACRRAQWACGRTMAECTLSFASGFHVLSRRRNRSPSHNRTPDIAERVVRMCVYRFIGVRTFQWVLPAALFKCRSSRDQTVTMLCRVPATVDWRIITSPTHPTRLHSPLGGGGGEASAAFSFGRSPQPNRVAALTNQNPTQ